MAEALYRKYRPQVFEDVVGQEPIVRTLKNAIEQDKVSHAYLFTGPRGTGKTTMARLLAKALLCQQGPTPNPDGTCEDCELIAEGAHPDVYELDAASRTGVDNVREEIIGRVQFAPARGRSKVYIIDEVHMLSVAAFNALLKTLEEPPSHVVFVLCTTDPQKVPETIHSRCQRFDFRRIAPESMVSRLGAICMAEGIEFEGEALDLVAHRAEGGLRNALTSLEQIVAFEDGKATLAGAERLLGSIDSNDMAEIMAYVGRRDVANCFRWTANYVETGADLAQFVRDMAEHVRNLYVMSLAGDDVELDVSEMTRRELVGELQWFGPDRLARLMGVLGDLTVELKTSSNARLSFEIALTRMVRPDSDLTIEALAERVEALESGYSAVAHVLPGEPPASAQVAQVAQVAQAGAQQTVQRAEATEWQPRGVQVEQPAGVRVEQREAPARQIEQQPVGQMFQKERTAQAAARQQARDEVQPLGQPQAQGQVVSATPSSPAAASASASAASPVSPLANPAALQRIWQAALSSVKKQKQAYGVLFIGSKATYDGAAGMVRVVFPAENAFAFSAVQKPDVQDALATALAKAAGEPVAFCFEQAGSDVRVQGAQPAASAQAAQVQPQQQAQPQQAQVQPQQRQQPQQQAQVQPQSQFQPQPQSQPRQKAQDREPQATSEPSRVSAPAEAAGARNVPDSYGDVPYEPVPYDEMPYDPVPYDDFDAPASQPESFRSASVSREPVREKAQPVAAQPAAVQPAAAQPVAAEPAAAQLAAAQNVAEQPAAGQPSLSDVQALLQVGFGGGVVFSEVDDG